MSPLTDSSAFVPFALELLVKTALLMLVAEAFSRLLRRAPAATRHLVWTVAVFAALVLPLLVLAGPRVTLPGLGVTPPATLSSPGFSPAAPAGAPTTATRSNDDSAAPIPPARVAEAAPVAPSDSGVGVPSGLSTRRALVLLWLAVGLALLARVLVGSLGAWHLVRGATPAGESWKPVLDAAARSLGLRQQVRLLSSERADVPMVWGVLRPAVVLPAAAEGWGERRRRLVLVHELAHVRRRDCLVQLFAHLTTALYWLNPLAWRAASRLRAERELACDDLVITTGARGSEYAKHLLDIARDAHGFRPGYGVALPMARPSQLEGRLLAILNVDRVARGSAGALQVGLSAAFAAVLVTVAVIDPWAPPTAIAQPRELVDTRAPIELTLPTSLNPEQVEALTRGLGAVLGEQVRSTLAEMMQNGQEAAAQTAEAPRGSRQSDTHKKVIDAMLGALSSDDAAMRVDAAQALAMMEDPAAVPGLVAALQDPEPRVRRQAAHGLGLIESAEAVPGLVGALSDDDDGVRKNVAWALGMIESAEAVPALLQTATDPSKAVREQAAWALGMIESAEGVDAAAKLLEDAEPSVREQAAWALGMIESGRGVPALVQALSADTSVEVRRQAAWALGMIESADAVPGLLEAIGDQDTELQLKVIWALGMIEDDRAIDGLLDAMKSSERRVQRAAMQAIAQITG